MLKLEKEILKDEDGETFHAFYWAPLIKDDKYYHHYLYTHYNPKFQSKILSGFLKECEKQILKCMGNNRSP